MSVNHSKTDEAVWYLALQRQSYLLVYLGKSGINEFNTSNLYKNLTTYDTDEITHYGLVVSHVISISDHYGTEWWPIVK